MRIDADLRHQAKLQGYQKRGLKYGWFHVCLFVLITYTIKSTARADAAFLMLHYYLQHICCKATRNAAD